MRNIKSRRSVELLLGSAILSLSLGAMAAVPARSQDQSTTAAMMAAQPDERPKSPSALGHFGDSAEVMRTAERGARSMRGGLVAEGRQHLTVRRPGQFFYGNWPISDMVELAAEEPSPSFDEAAQLIDIFKNALAENDVVSLAALLGLDPEPVLDNPAALEAFVAIRDGVAAKLEVDVRGRRQILLVGEGAWPFPYPIVRDDDGKWSFDTLVGLEEIVNRRIGENELMAIATAKALLGAQQAYASADRDGDGVLEYAQKLTSSDGQTDGLYWPDGNSVAGEHLKSGEAYGGYFGYRFRILKGQGENAPGGSFGYVINGNMVAGFALLAWPDRYAQSGLKTFMVGPDGTVYEADLGNSTDAIVKYIKQFDPDNDWELTAN